MKFHALTLSRNRHLTVLEKNEVNKLFDDKAKRMSEDLFEELADFDVIKTEESVGLTVVVLDVGKTYEQLEEDQREAGQSAKNAMKKIRLLSTMMMSSFNNDAYHE
jgi:hypothetical protein